MKHGSTIFLRLAVIVFGAIVAAICFFALPVIYREWPIEYPEIAQLNGIVVAGLGATAILFYAALYQVWKLLQLIDRNQAFSALAEQALRLVSYSATGISAIYGAGLPVVYAMAQLEDAPGLVILGTMMAFVSAAVAVFAAVLKQLLKSAIAMKSEHDLTV